MGCTQVAARLFTRIVQVVICVILLAGKSFGQFNDLSVTNDGSQVYFSTFLRLGSEAALHLPSTFAIYRVNAAGKVERLSTPPPFDPSINVSHINPQVSGDGAVFSYTERTACVGGSSCLLNHPTTYFSRLFIDEERQADTLGGSAQISRNGRYVLSFGQWQSMLSPAVSYNELRDLLTGVSTPVPYVPAGSRQAVTSDGNVLGLDNGGLVLWSAAGTKKIKTAETVQTAILNDAGTVVVYVTPGFETVQLRSIDLKSGTETMLAEMHATALPTSISNDGQLILFGASSMSSTTPQVWLVHPDGSGRRQLTDFAGGIDYAVLDGFGTAVIAVTTGRMVRIDTTSGDIAELIGPTPVCAPGFTALVPGSIFPFRGQGLASTIENPPAPLPEVLDGVRVLANSEPMPIVSVSPSEVWFQVPFSFQPSDPLTVELQHSSLFEGCPPVTVPVVSRKPYFFSDGALILAHENFSALVSRANPVQPGEIVHAYAVGLGAVTPKLDTGLATPLNETYRLTEAFDCTTNIQGRDTTLDVPFAGLAPGMFGIYQVDIRLPEQIPSEGLFISCGTPGNPLERHGGGVLPPAH